MVKDIVLGIVRHLATGAAGLLVAHGIIMENQTEPFIGSIFFLATIAWSVYDKQSRLQ